MYTDNELLFPYDAISSLKDLRGAQWSELVERVATLDEHHEEVLAFMLMMIRLNGCLSCETDSYRAMRGCVACAHQTLRRFKGTDQELFALFEQALHDIRVFCDENPSIDVLFTSELRNSY
ncbi:MAG: hypothetical protein CUN56_10885 [Phototrophicales bacterium]|nr:MAG: hypothetical protein CUN56_10885 [Phototrophicales bacterium]RMG77416.1 MAG: hypothetical protein D6711_01610 [Chloroflexota bacterium]